MSSYVNAPIHDLLIRIKNGYMARKLLLEDITHSKFKVAVLNLLVKYKFVESFQSLEVDSKKFITVKLSKIVDINESIPNIKFHSRPSRRLYVGHDKIRPVAWGRWISIISTNQWLMAWHVANNLKIGWELIAEIY